jgi:hypothetical protein
VCGNRAHVDDHTTATAIFESHAQNALLATTHQRHDIYPEDPVDLAQRQIGELSNTVGCRVINECIYGSQLAIQILKRRCPSTLR